MKRFVAHQTGQLVVEMCGAAVAAIAISAIGEPRPHNLPDYLWAVLDRLQFLARGNFGHSAISDLPVTREIALYLPHTAALTGLGAAMALLIGLPLGLLFVLGRAKGIASPVLQILTATPVFCAGLALSYGAVHLLHWTVGLNPPANADPGEALRYALLPVITVGLAGTAAVQLSLRRAAAKAAGKPFREGLKRLGLSPFQIDILYGLPIILAGLLASAGEILSALIAAAVVAEWVFHRDGIADLFVNAVALCDWNLSAMIVFLMAAATMTATYLGRVGAYLLAREEWV